VLSVGGRRAEADVSLARALARARAIENAPLEAQTLHQIALARVIEGDPETALPFLLEAVDVVRRVGSRASAADCLYALAAVALSQGESRLAAVSLATADDTITRVGTPVWPTTQAVLRRLRRDVEVGVEPDVLGRNDVDVFEVMSRVAAELSSASGGAEPGPPLERTDG
jgi:hypothetical protein